MSLSNAPVSSFDVSAQRIIFGREPVDKPFILDLVSGEDHVLIRADGVGHFVVE